MTQNMTAPDLVAKLQEILRPYLRLAASEAPIQMDEDLGKLGLDSMASIELLMQLEEQLGIVIPDEMLTAETFATGNHLLAVIEKLP